MSNLRKALTILDGEIKTPPFSEEARREAGYLLGKLQGGDMLGMPHSRPMPSIGAGCHELRVRDENRHWRIIYRTDATRVLVVEVFAKTTPQTPDQVINLCKKRLRIFDENNS